jgi:CsoR family transcriptional regulator, copper-sensing transcriptional repressor
MIADIKQRALHRSKILQGQLKGLEKMIDQEQYCIDILTQSLAIQKSLGSLNKLLLENHLKTHVAEDFASKSSEHAIDELLSLYELNNIRSK